MANDNSVVSGSTITGIQSIIKYLELKGIEATEEEINSVFENSLEEGSEVLNNDTFVQELAENWDIDPEDEELLNTIGTISATDGVQETLSYNDLHTPVAASSVTQEDTLPECFSGRSADKIQKDENGQHYVTVDEFDINKEDNIDCISRLIYNTYGVSLYSDEGREIYSKLVEANPDVLQEDYNATVIHPDQRINLVDTSSSAVTGGGAAGEGGAVTGEGGAVGGGAGRYVGNTTLSEEQVAEYAQKLQDSMDDGLGVNESAFSELINNEELSADDWVNILSYYESSFDKSFVQDVDGDFNGNDRTQIMNQMTSRILESAQQGNPAAIELLCSELHNATGDMWGTADEFVESVMNSASDEVLTSVMDNYNRVTGSEIYKDFENDFSGQTEKNYLNKLSSAYQNVTGTEYAGWDDGELSLQDGAGSFAQGVVDKAKEQVSGVVSTVTEHPVATAAAVGGVGAVCLAAGAIVGAPVVAAALGIVGVGGALYGAARAVSGAIEGMKSYNNAQTDAQAQEAMGDVGGSALEFGENVALGALSGAQTVRAFGAMRGAATAGNAAAGAAGSVDGALALPPARQSSASATAGAAGSVDDTLLLGAGTADDAFGAASGTSAFTQWQQSRFAQYVEPLSNSLGQLDDIATGLTKESAQGVRELQTLIQNFMLNPTDKTTYRQLAMAIHPDTRTITTIDASYLDELIKTVIAIRDQVLSAGV